MATLSEIKLARASKEKAEVTARFADLTSQIRILRLRLLQVLMLSQSQHDRRKHNRYSW